MRGCQAIVKLDSLEVHWIITSLGKVFSIPLEEGAAPSPSSVSESLLMYPFPQQLLSSSFVGLLIPRSCEICFKMVRQGSGILYLANNGTHW